MLIVKLIALTLLTIIVKVQCSEPSPTETFANRLVLKTDDSFLYWQPVKNESVTFEIHYKNTSQWFLFGLAATGSGTYSDVIVTWINADGTGHFSDRKLFTSASTNQITTTIDSEQNWRLLDAFVKDDYTVVKFTRPNKIVQCNSQNTDDLDIVEGNVNLVFVGGNSLPNLADSSIPIATTTTQSATANLLTGATGPFGCIPVQPKAVFTSTPMYYYSNQADLIDGIYRLYWNYTGTDIIGEIHCKTQGWVAFGISPNGGMDGSDVVVGWITATSVNFTDRHIVGRSVLVDTKQDWKLLKSKQTDEYTIFQFQRAALACDSEDLTIPVAAPSVIFAYGTSDPATGGDISYHGSNRGTKKLNLIGVNENKNDAVPNTQTIDFSFDSVVLPKDDTFYYCRGFKVPTTLTQKLHIWKWELLLSNYNFMSMHHVLLYECPSTHDDSKPNYEMNCDKNRDFSSCNTISLGWAVGGDLVQYFPDNTGYPIGGNTDYSYIYIQLHYDNPNKNIGYVEKLSVRFYATSNLRPNELGVLTLGTDASPLGIAIPPKVENFQIQAFCDNRCIGKNLATQNLTIVSTIPHTHTTGVGLYTKIVRKGVDIGYILANDKYDFNYQSSYILNPPVVITKDDQLITRCTYNTMSRTGFTLGGDTTKDEMCFHFLTVYPRMSKFRYCYSFPAINSYTDLLNDLAKNGDTTMTQITEYSYANLFAGFAPTFTSLASKPVTDSVRNKFVNFFNSTPYIETCGADFFPDPTNQIKPTNTYVAPDLCKPTTTTTAVPVLPGTPLQQIIQTITNIFNWFASIFRRF